MLMTPASIAGNPVKLGTIWHCDCTEPQPSGFEKSWKKGEAEHHEDGCIASPAWLEEHLMSLAMALGIN